MRGDRVSNNLRVLRRRRDFLAARVATYRHDGNPGYAQAELYAVNYAIAVIEEARRRGILHELAHVRVEA